MQPGERELERQGEQGDQDRPGEHAVVAVDVAVDDEVAEGENAGQRRDRRRRDDRDRRPADPGHQASGSPAASRP